MESNISEYFSNLAFPGVGQVDKVQVEGNEALIGVEAYTRAADKRNIDIRGGQCFDNQRRQFSAAQRVYVGYSGLPLRLGRRRPKSSFSFKGEGVKPNALVSNASTSSLNI